VVAVVAVVGFAVVLLTEVLTEVVTRVMRG